MALADAAKEPNEEHSPLRRIVLLSLRVSIYTLICGTFGNIRYGTLLLAVSENYPLR